MTSLTAKRENITTRIFFFWLRESLCRCSLRYVDSTDNVIWVLPAFLRQYGTNAERWHSRLFERISVAIEAKTHYFRPNLSYIARIFLFSPAKLVASWSADAGLPVVHKYQADGSLIPVSACAVGNIDTSTASSDNQIVQSMLQCIWY